MSTNDGPGVPPERSPEKTSVFRADFATEGQEPPAPGEPAVAGVDALPAGSALLVVKRARTRARGSCWTGSTPRAGRHPDSDIFLDDVTAAAACRFRREGGEFVVVDVGSLNGTWTSTAEPVDPAVLAPATRCRSQVPPGFLTGPREPTV